MPNVFIVCMRCIRCNSVMVYVWTIFLEFCCSGRFVVCDSFLYVLFRPNILIESPLLSNSMNPADYLVSEAPKMIPDDVLLYYIQCESVRSNSFTFTRAIHKSQNAIDNARSAMNNVSRWVLLEFSSVLLDEFNFGMTSKMDFWSFNQVSIIIYTDIFVYLQDFVGFIRISWLTSTIERCHFWFEQ